ncbi:hypothetical protein GDO81_000353 [Engystomops pustulosus]|uniref:Cyclic nucleotide-binding domain-containing protein n=1 Tax=Engystomops pustulosus TaxID=76066 RepID=A0AAV7D5D0_ENGPU|nr:hypothetical protein GDO81_000353 [Engystomops pustulosus]
MSTELLANEKRCCQRFQRVATNIKHVCGMLLNMKRYIGRNSVVEWAIFHLQMQIHSRRDLLFNISSFSKNNLKKDFETLKSLLSVRPRQRSPEILRQIQSCLKKNRAFQSLRDKTQLALCQHLIYQEYESKTLVIKEGHIPRECYIILSGRLDAMTEESCLKKQSSSSSTLYEVEEGDLIGDIGLVTNKRLVSFVCKSDVELLVIDKEAFREILAAKVQEDYSALCDFLRGLLLFSSWPLEKLELLVHCSLQRSYRAGTTVVVDSTKSSSLVLVKSGKCLRVVHLTQDRPSTSYMTSNHRLVFNRLPTVLQQEKRACSPHTFERSILPRSSYSASVKAPSVETRTRPRPQTAAPSTFSLKDRSIHSDFHSAEKELGDNGRHGQQHVNTSSSVRFVTVGTLERGSIFISEGADCIFIPTKLFLDEAPVKSKQIAQELVDGFPNEAKIRESYASLQMWRAYKEKCIGKSVGESLNGPHFRK